MLNLCCIKINHIYAHIYGYVTLHFVFQCGILEIRYSPSLSIIILLVRSKDAGMTITHDGKLNWKLFRLDC